jgi:hypothetical protein
MEERMVRTARKGAQMAGKGPLVSSFVHWPRRLLE